MLERLVIQQVRCFEHLDLELNVPAGSGEGWTILVGVNGVGKSTVLQSIVLAALDVRPVTGLVPAPWRLFRSDATRDGRGTLRIELSGEVSTRFVYPDEGRYLDSGSVLSRTPLLLALAARRRIARPGELYEADNRVLERVRGLFETDHPLLTQDPFAAFATKGERRAFAKTVRDVVTHKLEDGARMFPLVDVVELRGQGGVTKNEQLLEGRRFVLRYGADYSVGVSVEELSDGYQAMLAVILEILAHAAIELGEVPDPARLEAIVLIDEIEAHLHPQWQRTVVPLLRSVFPGCQFVATTHSPLVVGSALPGEVHVLEIGEDGAVSKTVLEERLAMLNADRIYEEVFGVARMAPPDVVERERDYLQQVASPEAQVDPELESFVKGAWEDAARAIGER